MTGRMAAKDNSYVNQEATKFDIYVNDRYIGEVQNNGLTEMFSVGLVTDAFVDGSNTIVRKYNTNPGTHYVTAETEYSILVPVNSEIAYIGSMYDYSELRPLPDFAVYPENVYIDSPSGEAVTAIIGEECNVKANVYNRGQRGGWADVVFCCGDTELHRVENLYIDAFSGVPVSFPWIPDGTENSIEVSLINKTQDVEERREDNNAASVPVTLRERSIPVIDSISPDEIVIDSIGDTVFLTADVSRSSDVVSACFSLDGAELPGTASAQYGDVIRYTLVLSAAQIDLGVHELQFSVRYKHEGQIRTLSTAISLQARNRDCDTDGHILRHHPEVKPGFDKGGCIEYWYCDSCGLFFGDCDAMQVLLPEDIVLEKTGFSAKLKDHDDTSVTLNIRLSGGLPEESEVILAVYGADGRMNSVYFCTDRDISAAQEDEGADITLKRGEIIKTFLTDGALVPLWTSIKLHVRD